MKPYEIIVIGGGHAGCEAALAAARLGCRTALISFSISRIAVMSCNPAVGGTAKGQLVREIDALGGEMGRLIDRTGIHFRMLGRGKGPAMYSPRAQADSPVYAKGMQEVLLGTPNLTLVEGEAVEILSEGLPEKAISSENRKRQVTGVRLADGAVLSAPRVVVTSGTFLRGLLHFGLEQVRGGRVGDPPADALSESLTSLGLRLGRMKTGTTPRLARDSVRFGCLEPQPGDEPSGCFSFRSREPIRNRVSCFITHTNEETHRIIRENLDRSPLYTKVIVGIGPRYCPSLEDKILRFPDRSRHQVFVEPEGIESELIYPSGIPTSLPRDVQERFVRTIPGFEEAIIRIFGYAVEYDFVPPTQLSPWLETHLVAGLFLAGQINGTSGYEEAAAQGLLAGINAVLTLEKLEPLVLSRSEAYAGVLVDDLVTKGTEEPYRLFTSRAEHRLCLRQDNADERLMHHGHRLGLIPEDTYLRSREITESVRSLMVRLERESFRPNSEARARLERIGTPVPASPVPYMVLLRRPEVHGKDLAAIGFDPGTSDPRVLERLEIEVKYSGYIERHQREVERSRGYEEMPIPEDLCFTRIGTLSNEARQKLENVRPRTLGQASRIPGISPADVGALLVAVRKMACPSSIREYREMET